MIGVFAAISAILLVALLAGRNDSQTILMVSTDGIDATKTLDEQPEFITEETMLKDDFEKFNGQIATSWEQLKGAKLRYDLPAGTPIPLGALTKTKFSGKFASETPMNHTLFKMVDVVNTLPPGVVAGDLIDVNLTVNPSFTEDEQLVSGPLLRDIKIEAIEDNTLYLMVTQNQFGQLALAKDIGTFILQLPGQKEVASCEESLKELQAQRDKAIENINGDKALSKEEKAEKKKTALANYDFQVRTMQCVTPGDEPTTIDADDIINAILNNSTSSNESFESVTEDLKEKVKKEVDEKLGFDVINKKGE